MRILQRSQTFSSYQGVGVLGISWCVMNLPKIQWLKTTKCCYLRILWVGNLSRAQLGDYSGPHGVAKAPSVTFSWWLAWSGGLTHLQMRSGMFRVVWPQHNTSSYAWYLDGAREWGVGEGSLCMWFWGLSTWLVQQGVWTSYMATLGSKCKWNHLHDKL